MDNSNLNGFKKKKKGRSTTIIGDSIVKDIKPHKIRNALPLGEKLYVKSFSGASTECMADHIKPTLRYKPDLIILHTGSNDLRSEKTVEKIAEDILQLAKDSKTTENEIIISGIVPRSDNLNNKGQKVNLHLERLCYDNNIVFIDNNFIKPSKHLNGSGLNLNYQGTAALASNFLNYIKY